MGKGRNPKKRTRNEASSFEDDSFNDSNPLESTTVDESIQAKINTLTSLQNPSSKEIMEGIGLLMKLQLNSNASMNKLTQSLADKIRANSTHIVNIKKSCNELKCEMIRNRGEINILHQISLEKDMIVTGFPCKPDPEKSINIICETYGLDKSLISNYYSYEIEKISNKSGAGNEKIKMGFLVLSFINKFSQIQFNMNRKRTGIMCVKQFMDVDDEKLANKKVVFRFKLTSLNNIINRELMFMKKLDHIHQYKYHNSCFWLMEKAGDKEVAVSTMEILDNFKKKYYEDSL